MINKKNTFIMLVVTAFIATVLFCMHVVYMWWPFVLILFDNGSRNFQMANQQV